MIDSIFRKSMLYRDKWNEKRNGSSYGSITIDAACRSCQKMYGEAIPYPVLDADGDPLKSSWENLQFFLEQQHRLVYWNVITRRIVDSKGEAIDFDVFCASLWGKANKAGLPVSLQDIKALLPVVAACHSFNPWSDYLTWCRDNVVSGADYIGQLAAALQLDYSVEQDAATVKKYLTKWLVQACQLAFNAEGMVMPQHILVFAGQGGIGKTRFVKWLMQERPQLVATGAAISPDNKDSIMAATEFGIVEVGELPRSMKAKDALKAFFTQSTDVLRKPYARGVQSFPRYTSYIATTNDRRVLLDDVGAGDRRYLCIALKDIDWKALQSINPAMVWGQSMYLAFEEKLPYWLNREEIAALNHSNLQFRKRTAFEQSVYDKLDWQSGSRRFTTAAALCEELGFRIENCNHVSRVLNNMVAAGEIAKPVQQGKAMEYSLPPTKRALFGNDYTVGNTGIK
ncbi:MAG: virulence-associated E family protein [Acidaminococcaceae bacterium]|jgi:predicted P-loop ATPase|nr:virulence-associated E family protein [Acidaminococcaceae bacterium]